MTDPLTARQAGIMNTSGLGLLLFLIAVLVCVAYAAFFRMAG